MPEPFRLQYLHRANLVGRLQFLLFGFQRWTIVCIRWDFSLFCNCFFLFLLILDNYWTLAIDVVRSSLTDKMVDLSLYQSTSISLRNFHLSSTAGARAPHSSLSTYYSSRLIPSHSSMSSSAEKCRSRGATFSFSLFYRLWGSKIVRSCFILLL